MLHDERDVGGLRLRIDRGLCVGFGDCLEDAAGLLELDGEDIAAFVEGVPSPGEAALRAACSACPVDALSLFDATGRQIAP